MHALSERSQADVGAGQSSWACLVLHELDGLVLRQVRILLEERIRVIGRGKRVHEHEPANFGGLER